jgi:hypothetical protein
MSLLLSWTWIAFFSHSFTAEVEDFANPIEPSSLGGAKIAAEIVKVVRTHPFESLAQP